MSVVRASKPHGTLFLLGMFSDWDSGGWVFAEVECNLGICIAEKTRKIAAVRSKCPEWWLVLSDHIGFGLSEFDRQQFRATVSIKHSWDRVILVNPTNYADAFEI